MGNLQINDSFEPYFAKRDEAKEAVSTTTPNQREMRQAMKELQQKRGAARQAEKPASQK